MIRFFYKTISTRKIKTLDRFKIGSWIYVEKPTLEELAKLEKEFDLEKGHLEDALDPYEAPRAEKEGDTLYLFARLPTHDPVTSENTTLPFLIIVAKNFLLTLSQEKLPFLDTLLKLENQPNTTQKTKFTFQILAQINDLYEKTLLQTNRQIHSLRIGLKSIKTDDLIRLIGLENTLNEFLLSLVPLNNSLEKLSHNKILRLYDEDRELMEDLYLESSQLTELAKSSLKGIANVRQAYSAFMDNSLNKSMQKLTALTIILNISTLISSFYGMNVSLPFASSPWAFWFLAFTALLLTTVFLVFFRRKNWF